MDRAPSYSQCRRFILTHIQMFIRKWSLINAAREVRGARDASLLVDILPEGCENHLIQLF